MNYTLSKQGFIIKKDNNDNEIIRIKRELTVSPQNTFNKNIKPESFNVFTEDNENLYIPKFYGIKNIGIPTKNEEFDGLPININFKGNLREKQLNIINNILPEFNKNNGGLLCLGCGEGKCLGKNTPIIMHDGTIKFVQDIKIGDKIMGDDSLPRKILSVSQGIEKMFKVIDEESMSSYIVNSSHILSLKYKTTNLTTNIIDIPIKEYLNLPNNQKEKLYGFRVPIIFHKNHLEINPYLLGVWLTSDNFNKANITIKNINVEIYIRQIILDNYNKDLYLSYNDSSNNSYTIKSYNSNNIFNNFINKYFKKNIKYIPQHYKCNNKENQLQLLAGIIDTIGYSYKNNSYEINHDNELLIDDIVFLIRSLGFVAIKKLCKYENSNIIKNYFSIKIIYDNADDLFGLLSYKKNYNNNNDKNYNLLNYKIKIEELGEDAYYGFEIDGNKRFLLGDFSVTHNTVLSLYLACLFKVKTLVIVHKSFLLNQWKDRASEFTDANIGIIQQNNVDIENKQIVIGMLQSIAKDKYSSETFNDFGLVIFDEAHHAPSKYFSRALPIINAKRTLALSATPNRADKLEKVLYWYFGDILYKQPMEQLNTVLVKIIKYNTTDKKFKEYRTNYGQDVNRPKTLNKIIEIYNRNKLIIKLIKELLEEEGRKLLILSDRIEHLNIIKESLNEITTISFYIGGMKQKKLDESAKSQIILATYSMASEALDIPELNTLLMVTPRKEVEQAIGRITRKKDHIVQPIVIDIVDQLPTFVRQSLHRRKFYSKKDFKIALFEAEEDEISREINLDKIKDIDNLIDDNENLDFID